MIPLVQGKVATAAAYRGDTDDDGASGVNVYRGATGKIYGIRLKVLHRGFG